jgi:hypothetical protein
MTTLSVLESFLFLFLKRHAMHGYAINECWPQVALFMLKLTALGQILQLHRPRDAV